MTLSFFGVRILVGLANGIAVSCTCVKIGVLLCSAADVVGSLRKHAEVDFYCLAYVSPDQ